MKRFKKLITATVACQRSVRYVLWARVHPKASQVSRIQRLTTSFGLITRSPTLRAISPAETPSGLRLVASRKYHWFRVVHILVLFHSFHSNGNLAWGVNSSAVWFFKDTFKDHIVPLPTSWYSSATLLPICHVIPTVCQWTSCGSCGYVSRQDVCHQGLIDTFHMADYTVTAQ